MAGSIVSNFDLELLLNTLHIKHSNTKNYYKGTNIKTIYTCVTFLYTLFSF